MTQVLTRETFDVQYIRIAVNKERSYAIEYQSKPFILEGTPEEAEEIANQIRGKYSPPVQNGRLFQVENLMSNYRPAKGQYTFTLTNDAFITTLLQ